MLAGKRELKPKEPRKQLHAKHLLGKVDGQ